MQSAVAEVIQRIRGGRPSQTATARSPTGVRLLNVLAVLLRNQRNLDAAAATLALATPGQTVEASPQPGDDATRT
jgi:hypothetical protein